MKNCMLLWREAHFEVRMCKTHHCRTTFGRRTPLWREAHVETKVLKTDRRRPLLEVEMSKKCTPLWREARLEVKSVTDWRSRTTFGGCDVEIVHATTTQTRTATTTRTTITTTTTLKYHYSYNFNAAKTPMWRFKGLLK